jgi:hypothetical protein
MYFANIPKEIIMRPPNNHIELNNEVQPGMLGEKNQRNKEINVITIPIPNTLNPRKNKALSIFVEPRVKLLIARLIFPLSVYVETELLSLVNLTPTVLNPS